MAIVKSPLSLLFKRVGGTFKYTFRPWSPILIGSSFFVLNMAGYFLFNYNKDNNDKALGENKF